MSPAFDRDLVCTDFNAELERLRGLGLRIDVIYPADKPHTAILNDNGRTVRLTSRPDMPPPLASLPAFQPEFVLTRGGGVSGRGRAGMHYRDLIPSRLGGRYIASHITIAAGGEVSDWVHFHRIAFQIIFVRRGWIRVVYEDQGEPFMMHAGDLVVQPPEIRHRVLESSAGAEVIEIGCPALHETFADHELELPNGRVDPARRFGGQRFLRHSAESAEWVPFNGALAQETEVSEATAGLVGVRTVRPGDSRVIAFAPHDGELVFGFVLEGSGCLDFRGEAGVHAADAFVIPPGEDWQMSGLSDDFRLLHVTSAVPPESA